MLSSLLSLNSTSSCNFCSDTIAMSILSLSVICFFILFSIPSLLLLGKINLLSETTIQDLMLNPSIRLLTILSDTKTINSFLISSLFYLGALILCLVNYFVSSYILLSINLLLVLITTCFLFVISCRCYVKAKIVTIKEIEEYIALMQWLKWKDNRESE